ncbi:MerR family transcriptional regulator [Xylophilus ampelinus]|uniref:MerR-like DNA binding protein n=1 Tax=Xylophilus ampelinus TaxID=54067 RepID=A0A318T2W2_9BURK|nr:MerR family transcriptional regulator [Xylophilus ampelinus]MCS4509022.1 MerR family transcriptional regulator [Xylophilus ampelinus]PYE79951.1 MerR-like DNA binding protein [Xylophilus ampelinus]
MVTSTLAPIPAKRYFTIGEVAELCDVKPHVLRYWEQEFAQLRPMKRRGNRRYYQHHEVLMIRRIRDLLYDEGFTISGARGKLQEWVHAEKSTSATGKHGAGAIPVPDPSEQHADRQDGPTWSHPPEGHTPSTIRQELLAIRRILETDEQVGL